MGCEQHRKYMLTIQHPQDRGLDHETIKDILASLNATTGVSPMRLPPPAPRTLMCLSLERVPSG